MAKSKARPAATKKPDQELEFHFEQTPYYRTIHADGFWGGPTGNGLIYMSAYSERKPIPTKLVHKIDLEGNRMSLGGETARETQQGVIREIEIGIYMNVQTAVSLRNWLSEKISELERVTAEIESEKKK